MSSSLKISDRIPLSDGNSIPIIVFASRADSIQQAFDLGWRAVDTAQEYGNEIEIGKAVNSYLESTKGSVKRSDVWVTSKIAGQPTRSQENLVADIKESVDKMGLGYIDLFIIHKPFGNAEGRKKQWLALEAAKKQGLVKSIGVSNFGVQHLEELKAYAKESPVVNQLEVTPFNQELELAKYCKEHKILIQPYSPIARGAKADAPALVEVAKEVGQPWSSVILRWHVQKGHNPVCGSRRPEANVSNAGMFTFSLSEEQMAKLDTLECGLRVCPENPLNVDEQPKYHFDGEKSVLL